LGVLYKVMLPIIGTVHADHLLPAVPEDNRPLPKPPPIHPALIADGEYFLARVRGDSMQLAGLLNDDWLLCCPTIPETGDIVVARLDGHLYVKRYTHRYGVVVLEPTSLGYDAIIVLETDVEIIGVMEHVLRYKAREHKSARKNCLDCLFAGLCKENTGQDSPD
jgi:SOS-response transcriptional repressor LexA